jgi:large subunit ribosomal protein L13
MKTYSPKASEITRKWFVVDATDVPLGRLASQVAAILRGKHKPIFAPHIDTGDHVIVVNAARVGLTGKKSEEPVYSHSQYPGGFKSTTRGRLRATRPSRLIERAVKGMLPHNSLGHQMAGKLKVYADGSHPHAAQQPEPLTLSW